MGTLIKSYLYYFLLFALPSCSFYQNERIIFDRKILKKLDNEYNEYLKKGQLYDLPSFSPLGFFDYYAKGENNHIMMINIKDLSNIYEKKYKRKNFYDFLIEVFDQKIILNCGGNVCFKLDKEITKIYQENKFEDFLKL